MMIKSLNNLAVGENEAGDVAGQLATALWEYAGLERGRRKGVGCEGEGVVGVGEKRWGEDRQLCSCRHMQ